MGPHKLNLIVYFWLINVKGDRKGQINYSVNFAVVFQIDIVPRKKLIFERNLLMGN